MSCQPCTLDERNCDVKREILEQFQRTGKTIKRHSGEVLLEKPLDIHLKLASSVEKYMRDFRKLQNSRRKFPN